MKKSILHCGIAAGAAVLLVAAPAAADPPPADSLAAPALTYYSMAQVPGGDGQEGYAVEVAGCVGTGGAPGVVSIVLTLPSGEQLPSTVSADGAGVATFNLGTELVPGTATLTATCDIYQASLPYPVVTVDVPAAPDSLPALSASLSDDGAAVVVSGSGCIAADGAPGEVVYSAVTPNGQVGPMNVAADAAGGWTVSLPAELGAYEVYAGCETAGWAAEYDPISFDVVETGAGLDTNATPGKAAAPELAATGAHTASLGWSAAVLVTGGAALAFFGRRREQ